MSPPPTPHTPHTHTNRAHRLHTCLKFTHACPSPCALHKRLHIQLTCILDMATATGLTTTLLTYYLMGMWRAYSHDTTHTGRRGGSMAFLGWLCVSPTDSARARTHTHHGHMYTHTASLALPESASNSTSPSLPPLWQTPGGCLNAPRYRRAPNTRHLAPSSLALRSSVTGATGSTTRDCTVWCSAPL